MRIELNFGGLSGASVSDFRADLDKLINKAEDVVSCFQSINKITHNINGGVGNLQGAVDSISARIKTEQQRKTDLEKVRTKADSFVELVKRIDKEVADKVNQNTEEFYEVNPWAKPPGYGEKSPLEKAFDWLCEKGGAIIEGVEKFREKVGQWGREFADTISKTWTSIKRWCSEHKEALIKIAATVAIIAALGAAAILTGGTIIGPLALAAFKGAVSGAVVSALISGGMGVWDEAKSGDATAGSLFNAFFDGAADGAFSGAISGAIGGAAGYGFTGTMAKFMGAGKIGTKLAVGLKIGFDGLIGGVGSVASSGASYFIENGTLEGFDAGKTFIVGSIAGSVTSGLGMGMSKMYNKMARSFTEKINTNTANKFQEALAKNKAFAKHIGSKARPLWYESPDAAISAFDKANKGYDDFISAGSKKKVVKLFDFMKESISGKLKPFEFGKSILNKPVSKFISGTVTTGYDFINNIHTSMPFNHMKKHGGGGGHIGNVAIAGM